MSGERGWEDDGVRAAGRPPPPSRPEPGPPPPPPVPAPGTYEPFRPAGSIANALAVLLVLWVPLSAVAVGSDVAEYQLLTTLADDPLAVTDDQVLRSDIRQGLIGLTQLVMFLVTGVMFIVWLRRVYRNLEPLGARRLRYGSGWTVGAWFVPFLNLWRPKQLVNDAWRGSDPDLEYGTAAWREVSIPRVVTAWWVVYLVSSIFSGASLGSSASGDVEQLRISTGLVFVADALDIAGAVLALWVVLRTTDRQNTRAGRFGLPAPQTWTPRPAWLVAGGAAGVLLAAGAALGLAPDIAPSGLPVATRGDDGQVEDSGAIPADDLREGDCFNDPRVAGDDEAADLFGVEVVPCDQPHHYEAYADITLEEPSGAPYPGDETLTDRSLQLCYGAFETTIAPDLEATPYDVFFLHPTSQSWAVGDRAVLCAVMNYDGTKLQQRVERLDP